MKKIVKLFILGLTVLFTACDKDDNNDPNFDVPSTYTFERNGSSTVAFDGQTTRILMSEELNDALLGFQATETELIEMYANETSEGGDANPFSSSVLNESSKSIRSKVAASADFFSSNTVDATVIKQDFADWISGQVNEIFPYQNELAASGKAGQIADGTATRYVNAKGLEFDQAVIKGLLGALMTDQMLNNYLSSAVLDAGDNRSSNDDEILVDGTNYTTMEHKWDEAYGYLYGNAPDKSNPNSTLGADDSFLNKYLGRMEGDPDFAGMSTDIFEAFKLGRAAIVAGEYEIRDEQANIIREKISEMIGVRAVYYLKQAKLTLGGENMGTALHDLSEGYGFIYSLQFTRQPNSASPYFSKEEVDEFLNDLYGAPNGFWDVTPATLDELADKIAARFNFTVEQAAN